MTILIVSLQATVSLAQSPGSLTDISFDRDVRPILSGNCFACHGFDAAARNADLRLDNRTAAVDESGAIVPGDPESSPLIERIFSNDEGEMMPPPESGRKLTESQKQTLRQWIQQGAAYEKHWAFIPPQRPDTFDQDVGEQPIDRLIQSRLVEANLTPSPLANSATLLRRLSLDLIGLPPTLAEINAFVAASKTDPDAAYAALVERLLASPHYGERWGRWWLDQARYADSNGYSIDGPREIWLYRDWVVAALNDDLPFDQFTIEQLAGDLLPDATQAQKIATGFHRNTQINQEGGVDPEQFRIDSIFDRVGTTGTVWLGLTVGCAQCHDHKFDPVMQKEFYELFAFFNNQDEPKLNVYPEDVDATALLAERKAINGQLNALVEENQQAVVDWQQSLDDSAKDALEKNVLANLEIVSEKRNLEQQWSLLKASNILSPDVDYGALEQRLETIKKDLAKSVSTLVLAERSKPRQSTVFIKGDFTRPDVDVQPGTPAVLHPFVPAGEAATRLDLARWIVSPENPLTARVIANRIWQQYFGRGLVETDSDFGLQGTSPTHPELLDWLAIELRNSGWSLKALHRAIVHSYTYRQSSRVRPEYVEQDPLNLLLSRQNRLRLDAEIVRDVALVASELFSPTVGGPPVFPPIPDGVMNLGQTKRDWNVSTGDDRYRRGFYTFVYRVTPPPALNVFDAPDGLSSCTRRLRSNTPLQALTLLNDAGFFEFAQAVEKLIERDGLAAAFERCTSRKPSAEELELLGQLDTLGAARALLNLDETINRE